MALNDTLPFACPLSAPKRGLGLHAKAQDNRHSNPGFFGSNSHSGMSSQSSAECVKSVVFALLTGGLLVRVQPEEPNRSL